MKLPYREGTIFALPLRRGGYAVGIVARMPRNGKVILGYFFGPRRHCLPELSELQNLTANQAIMVIRFGDLGLIDGSWPVLGALADWKRSDWPMPVFLRTCLLSGSAWRVYYSDKNPNKVEAEEPWVESDVGLEAASLYGAGAVEIALDLAL